jgi:RDD family
MHFEIVTVAGQQYHKATWPRRIAGRLLDITLLVGACTVAGENFLVITVPLSIVYLLIGDGLLRGASLGKRLTGMKVIDAKHGGPCSIIQDLVRHRYLFFTNPVFLLLTAYDSAQGCFDNPELYIVRTTPLTTAEREARCEKPAKLDLAGMRVTLQKIRDESNNAN